MFLSLVRSQDAWGHSPVSHCQVKYIQIRFTFHTVGQSSFITSDLGLLQHLTAVLLPQRQFSQSACWPLLIYFISGRLQTGFLLFSCSGCDCTHWSSLLNSLILIGGIRFSFYVCVLERISLTSTDCRPCPALVWEFPQHVFNYLLILNIFSCSILACKMIVNFVLHFSFVSTHFWHFKVIFLFRLR